MMVKRIEYFDLEQIAASGQCFRMTPCPGETRALTNVSGGRFLKISQTGTEFTFLCPEEDDSYWEEYFDLHTDYGAFLCSIDPEDRYLQNAAKCGGGIRILRQDPWEMIITFVISQQQTIPVIRRRVEELCRRYGTELEVPENLCRRPPAEGETPESFGAAASRFFSFPSPEQLNRALTDDLTALKLGYRAKYIKRLCEDACAGRLDLNRLRAMDYPAAMEYLQGFFGIGEKVANCVCLFGLHHIDAFPVDTWIKKILLREYAPAKRADGAAQPATNRFYDALVQKHFSKYRGCAGVMQQYMFFYERVVVSGRQLR